jgi:transposase, IS5 family
MRICKGDCRFFSSATTHLVPDANSIWNLREALARATLGGVPAIAALFRRFEAQLRAPGFIAMGGQSVDATVVSAPKQRNTEDAKRALRNGRLPEGWAQKPAKLRQKEFANETPMVGETLAHDACWTVKQGKAKLGSDGAPKVAIAIPIYGCKNPVGIDRRHGLIRT